MKTFEDFLEVLVEAYIETASEPADEVNHSLNELLAREEVDIEDTTVSDLVNSIAVNFLSNYQRAGKLPSKTEVEILNGLVNLKRFP